MKSGYSILRDRPKLRVIVTRDSVCAGDDVMAPNQKEIEIHSFTEPEDFIRAVAYEYGMPQIQGGRATWEVLLNDRKIGVIAQEWAAPRPTVREIHFDQENRVHLHYHAQAKPESFV